MANVDRGAVMELRGRWALVTGAARRVGRAIAFELAGQGANIVVHYRRSRREAEATATALQALGVTAEVVAADLADADAVRALAATVERRTGGVDVLVNNAANFVRTPWRSLDETVWDQTLDLNLKAPFLLSLALGRAMHERGLGVIVNVVDWAAERPFPNYLPYSVSKAGLVCLTKGLARELAPAVRVNGVAPGPVLLPDDATPTQAAAIERVTPLGLGHPEAVARCVRFLVQEATFSTGAIVHVDGGRAIV